MGVELRGLEIPRAAEGLGQVGVVCQTEVSELEVELAVAHVPVEDVVRLNVSVAEIIVVQIIQSPQLLFQDCFAELIVVLVIYGSGKGGEVPVRCAAWGCQSLRGPGTRWYFPSSQVSFLDPGLDG